MRIFQIILPNVFARVREDARKSAAAILFLAVYAVVTQIAFGTVCPFAILTGQPCPGCGLTHAGLCLLTGRFAQAAARNAAIYLWAPFLLYLCTFRYLLGRKIPAALFLAASISALTLLYHILRMVNGTLAAVPCPGILPLVLSGSQ